MSGMTLCDKTDQNNDEESQATVKEEARRNATHDARTPSVQ